MVISCPLSGTSSHLGGGFKDHFSLVVLDNQVADTKHLALGIHATCGLIKIMQSPLFSCSLLASPQLTGRPGKFVCPFFKVISSCLYGLAPQPLCSPVSQAADIKKFSVTSRAAETERGRVVSRQLLTD